MKKPPEQRKKTLGKILSLDIGSKTIGVAVSDELGITANGITTIYRKSATEDLEKLRELTKLYNPTEIVVGLPYNQDSSLGSKGEKIKKFALLIENTFNIQVKFWDESFSTKTAEHTLIEAGIGRKKRKSVIDKMAATVILREYLSHEDF